MLGATNEELGELFGVTKETIQDWMRTKKDFRQAVYEGREGADAKVAAALFKRATGMTLPDENVHFNQDAGKFVVRKTSKHLAPDPGSAKFILANRRAVKERTEGNTWAEKIEQSGPGGGPIDVAVNFVRQGATRSPAAPKEKA